MNVNLNNMQRQTINAFNSIVHLLNKSQPDAYGFIKVDAENLASKVRELHNNLAFFGGLVDDNSSKSYWEVKPDAEIKEITWDAENN